MRAAHVLMILAGVVLAASLLVAGLAFRRAQDETQLTCGAALRVRDAVVNVFIDAQTRTRATTPQTQAEQQRKQALEFYQRSIARLNAVHCDK